MPTISERLASYRAEPERLRTVLIAVCERLDMGENDVPDVRDPLAFLAALVMLGGEDTSMVSRVVAAACEVLGIPSQDVACLGLLAPTEEARSAASLLDEGALWDLFSEALSAADAGALRNTPFAGHQRRALSDRLEAAIAPAAEQGRAREALAYLSATLYLARPRDFLSLDGAMHDFLTSPDGLGIAEDELPATPTDYLGLVQFLAGEMESGSLPYRDFAQMGRAAAVRLPVAHGLFAADREELVRTTIRPELVRLWPRDQELVDAECMRLTTAESPTERTALAKRQMRRLLRRLRSEMSEEKRVAADAHIAAVIATLPEWRTAKTVFAYLSFGAEVDTRVLIARAWSEGKRVALPRVVASTHDMRWYEVENFEGLEKSSLGVEEPPEDPARMVNPSADDTALALVPGLAFDAKGFRVGYGGGFYDTFLSTFPGRSVGLCRAATLMDDLSALGVIEPHDLAVERVATDAKKVSGRATNGE